MRILVGSLCLSLAALSASCFDAEVSDAEASTVTGAGCDTLSLSIYSGCNLVIEDKYGPDAHGYCDPSAYLHKDSEGAIYAEKVRYDCEECGQGCGSSLGTIECEPVIA